MGPFIFWMWFQNNTVNSGNLICNAPSHLIPLHHSEAISLIFLSPHLSKHAAWCNFGFMPLYSNAGSSFAALYVIKMSFCVTAHIQGTSIKNLVYKKDTKEQRYIVR